MTRPGRAWLTPCCGASGEASAQYVVSAGEPALPMVVGECRCGATFDMRPGWSLTARVCAYLLRKPGQSRMGVHA